MGAFSTSWNGWQGKDIYKTLRSSQNLNLIFYIFNMYYSYIFYVIFVKVICSLKNLKKLDLYCECERTLEDLARVFQSCSKLTELNTSAFGCKMDEMTEDLIDKLRPGFQRLRRLDILCSINNDSWLGFQKMLTCVKR
jgi:hypothetical protein